VSKEAITDNVCQVLRKTTFSNRRLIAPRRLDEIGRGEAQAFVEFLGTGDEKAVNARGQELALEGLGHRSILSMTQALRLFCRENVNPGDVVADRYITALLEGYMAGRESDLLREQEHTREAYLRARERQVTS
jgi:hypothetical protein